MHAVSVTWNGTTITGPVLIYQDELLVNDTGISESPLTVGLNDSGSLVCRSESQADTVGWHTPNNAIVNLKTDNTTDFRQKKISAKQHISTVTYHSWCFT